MSIGPFRRMVVIGDSISYGMCAAEPEHEWNQVVGRLLRDFQDEGPTVFNRGLPAGVLSPRCPGYEESAKPSLLERYQEHCVDLEPDLVVVAEGLNDMVPACRCRSMSPTWRRSSRTSSDRPEHWWCSWASTTRRSAGATIRRHTPPGPGETGHRHRLQPRDPPHRRPAGRRLRRCAADHGRRGLAAARGLVISTISGTC